MMIILASSHTGRVRYEDIAKALFGKKFAVATAIMNLMALVGFNMSYVVYVSHSVLVIVNSAPNQHA
jgi:amino acid permease